MAVRASEVSVEYVAGLRHRGYSWSVIARMTGAPQLDLQRFHGGLMLDESSPVPALPARRTLCGDVALPVIVVVPRPDTDIAEAVAAPAPAPVKSKSAKPAYRSSVADKRLATVLVAAGMGLKDAPVLVQLFRANGERIEARHLVAAPASDLEIKDRMQSVSSGAACLGIRLHGGRGGYALTRDSRQFMARLEAANGKVAA